MHYQTFQNYLSSDTSKHSDVLKPIFRDFDEFVQFDLLSQMQSTLTMVEELKLKDPKIYGKLARKIVKQFIMHSDSSYNPSTNFKCISELKQQVLENVEAIVQPVAQSE